MTVSVSGPWGRTRLERQGGVLSCGLLPWVSGFQLHAVMCESWEVFAVCCSRGLATSRNNLFGHEFDIEVGRLVAF